MALVLLPQLLKILIGVETVFSIVGAHIMTFHAIVCSLSYLCLDHLLKASYCLRCFYGESLRTGEDLKVELRSYARPGLIVTLLLAVLLAFGPMSKALAQPSAGPVASAGGPVTAHRLDSAIESVIHYP